jgi:amino acid transporter
MSSSKHSHDADAEQLKALGYSSDFNRSMSFWENFALGFTYLSPVVGVYTLFSALFPIGGPMMIWAYAIAGFGQMMVCLVFGEIVSQFPISGGIYPWGRRLVGKRWAWMVGWIYGWALFTSIAGIAAGAGPLLSSLIGGEVTGSTTTILALILIAVSTVLNLMGTKLLARVAMFGFICELVGAIVVGAYLLVVQRHYSLDVFFSTFEIGKDTGSYLPYFLTAALAGLFCCYGFEACGDVAEETPNPGVAIPKSMRMTIYIGIASAIFVCLALILAVPDIPAVLAGQDKDPLSTILTTAFGPIASKAVIAVVMVSFLSCVLSLQAAASRLVFSYARDKMMFASATLSKLSPGTHVPVPALIVAGVLPSAIVCVGFFIPDAITTIISFAVIGIYVAFQMIVLAALYARSRGWRPNGRFTMGRWGLLVNIAALTYGLGAVANILWPYQPDQPWYVNYAMALTTIFVVLVGFLYMALGRPYDRGTSPAGDAWHISGKKAKKVAAAQAD